MTTSTLGFLSRESFDALIAALVHCGYRCEGPTVRDGAIVYAPINGVSDLPRGVTDRQQPGSYRVVEGDGDRLFAWATGPQALKPYLFAPRETVWRARREAGGVIAFTPPEPDAEPVAVIGVRACDLAALRLQDRHFLEGPYPDPFYAARRENLLVVAVNCSHPAQTCFCVSTGDGPHAKDGFDLALTELDSGFLVHVGSAAGRRVAERMQLGPAEPAHSLAEEDQARSAAECQSRALPGRNLRDTLFENLEHPRWDDVAARCLSCGNCTSVCPTCFCHAETEVPSLAGDTEHVREWDSCFTQRHAYMHGYPVRTQIRQRYRQWLTHKLGGWHDQYGRSGCVGCGRCVSWCPVGIDITEEATAICGVVQAQ